MPTLKGKWYFKTNIEVPDVGTVPLQFSVTNESGEVFTVNHIECDHMIQVIYFRSQQNTSIDGEVYVDGSWQAGFLQTINIESAQEVSEDFYIWFTKNAVNLQPTGTWRFNKILKLPAETVETVYNNLSNSNIKTFCTVHDTDYGQVDAIRLSVTVNTSNTGGISSLWSQDTEGDAHIMWALDVNDAIEDASWVSEDARLLTFNDRLIQLNPDFALWFYENAHSMELKLYSECYIAETADKIRECVNDNTLTFKVSDLADGVQTAYDAGYSQGMAKTEISLQAKATFPSAATQIIKPDSGYDGLSSVTVTACSGTAYISDTNSVNVISKAVARISSTERDKLIPSNIKSGVNILGVTGTYSGSAPQTCDVELYISAYQGATCIIYYMNEDGTFATYIANIGASVGYQTVTLTVQKNSLLALFIQNNQPDFSLGVYDGDGGLEGLQMISKNTSNSSQGIAIYKVLNDAREELVFTND